MASTDEAVTKDILETLEDGKDGYTKGAEKLENLNEAALTATFKQLAAQRTSFADELQKMANSYGDDPDRSGSVVATLHRGWMSLKDALTKDSANAVVETAQQGDDHAITEYEKALQEEISTGLRDLLTRQLAEIRAARASLIVADER
jgi:uncharacterized protein (TIGR02284 family)